MAKRWIDRDLIAKVHEIINEAETYHNNYYVSEIFNGPSLHFHRRALGLAGSLTEADKIEMVYAALTSWGMHRMGAIGSKMQPFYDFKQSVISARNDIDDLRRTSPNQLSSSDWVVLERVFKGIKVMASGTTIVGNSKVIAHLLPNLVAPVDREYTLNYLFGNKDIQNDLEQEWQRMRKILLEFYYPIACNRIFQKKVDGWMTAEARFPWDTSILKVIDNLVIGAMRKKNDAIATEGHS